MLAIGAGWLLASADDAVFNVIVDREPRNAHAAIPPAYWR
jgi:hypothetical protein